MAVDKWNAERIIVLKENTVTWSFIAADVGQGETLRPSGSF